MKVIGVSGPIGAGKSSVVKALTEDRALARNLGGSVHSIDADAVLREARRTSLPLQRAICAIVPEAQREDGSLDSVRLSSAAFERPETLTALEQLQWPIAREAISAARAAGEASGAALLLDLMPADAVPFLLGVVYFWSAANNSASGSPCRRPCIPHSPSPPQQRAHTVPVPVAILLVKWIS